MPKKKKVTILQIKKYIYLEFEFALDKKLNQTSLVVIHYNNKY